MGMHLELHSDYGYVVLVIVSSWVLLQWLAFRVVKARRIYEVQYPTLYSPTSKEFNCIQRAHQNTLEVYPVFLVFLIFGGVLFPKLSAAAGFLWVVSRVVYAFGYYTFDPEKRNRGVFGYIGLLTLLVNTIIFALKLLGVV